MTFIDTVTHNTVADRPIERTFDENLRVDDSASGEASWIHGVDCRRIPKYSSLDLALCPPSWHLGNAAECGIITGEKSLLGNRVS